LAQVTGGSSFLAVFWCFRLTAAMEEFRLASTINYKTKKYVKVRDLKVGLVSKVGTLAVFIYVVIYQCWYHNRHFLRVAPDGIGRLQLQRPTAHHCNPNHPGCKADYTAQEDLPYCERYKGDKSEWQLPCEYVDEKHQNPSGKQHYHLLVPTRITKQKQKATGDCGPLSKNVCENAFEFEGDPETIYVADIERFTLLIDHAFEVPLEAVEMGAPVRRGDASKFPGAFEVCEDPLKHIGCREVPIPCISGCDALESKFVSDDGEGDKADEGFPGFFSIKVGDIIPMKKLLQLAGVDLGKSRNYHNESMRYEGFVIQILVDYQNLRPLTFPPWKTSPIQYVYRVGLLPIETYKEVIELYTPGGDSRTLLDTHGVFVRVKLSGSIAFFDITQLILIMTTSLGLLAVADACTDFYARYIWHFKEDYKRSKIDDTRDFNKDDTCCGFALGKHGAAKKSWADHEEKPVEFIRQFRALDGDTLGDVAELLLALHRTNSERHQDVFADHKTRFAKDRMHSEQMSQQAQSVGDSEMMLLEPARGDDKRGATRQAQVEDPGGSTYSAITGS